MKEISIAINTINPHIRLIMSGLVLLLGVPEVVNLSCISIAVIPKR